MSPFKRTIRRSLRAWARGPTVRLAGLALAVALGLQLSGLWAWPETAGSRLSVHFLNVGQGDASLVRCGDVQALIDGGPDRSVLVGLGRTMPLHDRRLEYVVLSHPHGDHADGLYAVLERYDVGRLVVSRHALDEGSGRRLAEIAESRGVPLVEVGAGDSLPLGECASFEVLWPGTGSADALASSEDPANELSLVLELRRKGGGRLALFTGDIGGGTEVRLVEKGSLGPVHLLKVPHHGSRYSSDPAFVAAVRPDTAVVGVGENRYGQPAESVLRRYRAVGAETLRTDLDGLVSLPLLK